MKTNNAISNGFIQATARTKVLYVLLAVMISFIQEGCKKVDAFREDLDMYLKSLPPISEAMPAEQLPEIDSTRNDTALEYITKTEYYSAAAGFNEQIVLNPQTDVIYPGALVKGESILDGSYILIPANRKPITISTSLTGGATVSVVVQDPKLSTVREAINALMDQEYDVPPANMGFTIEQAYSEEQLEMSLHASYKMFGVSIKGGFDYSNSSIKTRLVAKFIQNYYTLDMDLPNRPSDLFEDDVDRALIGTYMPMYVSTVTFGRMALFTIESELDEEQVRTFLDGSYASIDAQTSSDFESLKAHSTMKVYILGGSGSASGATIDGWEAFKNYIREGGNFSKESPGAPIAYKLRYIRDNSIGKIVFAASYPIRTAIPRTDNLVYDVKTRLYSFDAHASDAGGNLELYGTIQSWPESLGFDNNYIHWSGWTYMGESAVFVFPENNETVTYWNGLPQDDIIYIKIRIVEEDDWSNDEYTIKTYFVPVSDIILNQDLNGYYDKKEMRVYDGTEYIDVTFRFTATSRHLAV